MALMPKIFVRSVVSNFKNVSAYSLCCEVFIDGWTSDIQGGFFYWSALEMTKNEKSLSTRTGPTLQKDQFKYFDLFSDNLLRFDT